MAAFASAKDSAGKLRSELRWFSTATALVDRSDRNESLLDRYSKLDTRLQFVDDVYRNFNTKILDISDEDYPQPYRDLVHADYDQIMDYADRISQRAREISASKRGESPASRDVKPSTSGLLSKLPTLDLPRFDGRLDQWLGFINLFESLVHARSDLGSAQKLAYLFSVLEGEARGLVQHLEINDGNYLVARNLLIKRYQNKRCLADTHIGQLLGLPVVSRVSALRSDLLNPLMIAINALERLDLPVSTWSYMLVHIVLKKLPAELRARFEQKYGGDDATHLPAFDDLKKFLEDECRMVDMTVVDRSFGQQLPRSSAPTRNHAFRRPEVRHPPRFAAVQSRPECTYCKSPSHKVASCSDFTALHVASRRRLAKARGWCFSCLGNHFQRDCPNPRPCTYCGGQHLKLLCANNNGIGREHERQVSPTGSYERRHRYENRSSRPSRSPPRVVDSAAARRPQGQCSPSSEARGKSDNHDSRPYRHGRVPTFDDASREHENHPLPRRH